jgi:hypothetical protein
MIRLTFAGRPETLDRPYGQLPLVGKELVSSRSSESVLFRITKAQCRFFKVPALVPTLQVSSIAEERVLRPPSSAASSTVTGCG